MDAFKAAAVCVLFTAMTGYGQRVTATARVSIDGKVQTVRQINGRWWSDDNRQLTKPKGGGFIWWISGTKPLEFHHHRPVELARAESLHIFMNRDAVRSLLGEPNQTLDDAGIWYYYAEDGTALFIRFLRNQLTDARYEHAGWSVQGRPVESVAREVNGRDMFKVMADQAWQERDPAAYAKYKGGSTAGSAGTTEVRVSGPAAEPKRRIAPDLLDSIHEGMSRAEVVSKLGDPNGGLEIVGGGNDSEDLSYALDPAGQVTITIRAGKVAQIRR